MQYTDYRKARVLLFLLKGIIQQLQNSITLDELIYSVKIITIKGNPDEFIQECRNLKYNQLVLKGDITKSVTGEIIDFNVLKDTVVFGSCTADVKVHPTLVLYEPDIFDKEYSLFTIFIQEKQSDTVEDYDDEDGGDD